MVGHNRAPPSDPPDGGTLPDWLLGEDELGQVIALQMRVRQTPDENSDENELSLPSDPFLIGSAVILALGSVDARKVHASKEARGSRYILRTKSRSICEKLKQISELPDHTPVEVIEHPGLNVVQGVVYDLDTIDKSEEYIKQHLQEQGVCSVRRITKRRANTVTNTPLLVVTFRGSILPKYIYFGVLRINVRQYYQSPMFCYRCANFGHTKKNCDDSKNQLICLNCSGTHKLIEGTPCTKPAYCKNCQQEHSPTSKECPIYREEEAIIRLKTNRGLTYAEARREFREANKGSSYASAVQSRLRIEAEDKDRTIGLLKAEIETLKQMVSNLKSQIGKNRRDPHRSTNQSNNDSNGNDFSEDAPTDALRISPLAATVKAARLVAPSQPRESALKATSKAFHISLERIDQKHTDKTPDHMDIDPTRSSKRKGVDNKKDSPPDSPERKRGGSTSDLGRTHRNQSKRN